MVDIAVNLHWLFCFRYQDIPASIFISAYKSYHTNFSSHSTQQDLRLLMCLEILVQIQMFIKFAENYDWNFDIVSLIKFKWVLCQGTQLKD